MVRKIFEDADAFNVNREKISILGYSSGANISTNLVRMGIDQGTFHFNQQILLSPWLDLSFSVHDNNPFTEQQDKDKMLTTETLKYLATLCLKDSDNPRSAPTSPLFETNFKGFPRTTVMSPEFDCVTGTAHAYVEKLERAGVEAKLLKFPGQTHNFFIARRPGVMDDGDNPADTVARVLLNKP